MTKDYEEKCKAEADYHKRMQANAAAGADCSAKTAMNAPATNYPNPYPIVRDIRIEELQAKIRDLKRFLGNMAPIGRCEIELACFKLDEAEMWALKALNY